MAHQVSNLIKANTIPDIEMAKINHRCQQEVVVKIQLIELLGLVPLLICPKHQVNIKVPVLLRSGLNLTQMIILRHPKNIQCSIDGPSTHRSTTPPPVMPEKTKIHLRTNQPQSLNPALNQKASNQQSSKLRNGMSSNPNRVGSSDQSSSSKNKRVKDVKSQNAKVVVKNSVVCFL